MVLYGSVGFLKTDVQVCQDFARSTDQPGPGLHGALCVCVFLMKP